MKPRAYSDTRDLFAFILTDGGLLRSPVFLYIAAASGSRALLIVSLNETAERGITSLWWVLLILGSILATMISLHLSRVQGAVLVQALARKLRRRIATQVLDADIAILQRRESGQIFNALTHQANQVATATTRIAKLVEALLLVALCIGYMLWQSWAAALATIAAFAAGISLYLFFEITARSMVREANAARSRFYDRMTDLIRGYRELRLRRAKRDDLAAHVDRTLGEVENRAVTADRYFSYGYVGAQSSLYLMMAAVVLGLPILVNADSIVVLQILTVVLFAFGPLEGLVSSLPNLVHASVALRAIRDIETELARNAEPASVRRPPPGRPSFSRLELKGVTAHLTRPSAMAGASVEDRFTLGPLDLVLEPGQAVFIAGGNGTGKSTLLHILTGLRHPDAGEILLDGVPVPPDDMGRYRELFSAVFSEFHLFRTLYGMTAEEREKLQHHIEELGLAEGVSVTGDEFSSLALSTGQMRRLALSMALAEERPVIVLDEFAADQDPARRAFFYDVLVPRLARAGHLVIAVTHDAHCFEKCDRLIEMADGQVASDRRIARRPDLAAASGD